MLSIWVKCTFFFLEYLGTEHCAKVLYILILSKALWGGYYYFWFTAEELGFSESKQQLAIASKQSQGSKSGLSDYKF